MTDDGFDFHHSCNCSGTTVTFKVSIHALRTFGTASNVAVWHHKPIVFYPMDVTFKEKYVIGSMCTTILDFEQVIDAYKEEVNDFEEVHNFVTIIVHLEDGIEKGFKELPYNKDNHIKIQLSPKEKYKTATR